MGRGQGMGGAPGEKAKDFKGAIKRLFKELEKFTINDKIKSLVASLNIELTQELELQTSKLE